MTREIEKEEDEEKEFVVNDRFAHPSLRIFEDRCKDCDECDLPIGYDAITIYLDGRLQSDLDWKKKRKEADRAIEKGYGVLWDMQLGIFQELRHPLTHQSQFLSLILSLEHFRDTLWKEYRSHTVGICLFRGSADCSRDFPWDETQEQNLKDWLQENVGLDEKDIDIRTLQNDPEGQQLVRLFCRDVIIEYVGLLAARLPDSLVPYLFLDLTLCSLSQIHSIQLLHPERFERFKMKLKGLQLPIQFLGSEERTDSEVITVGVCIPPIHMVDSKYYEKLQLGLQALQEQGIPFKLIAENHLTTQWDDLDWLLYVPSSLSMQGKRKIHGFCAAGGTVVSIGELLGFAYEMGLEEWLAHEFES